MKVAPFVLLTLLAARAGCQDTAFAGTPWRLSRFPYISGSSNDGVMLLYRGIAFRQSTWLDRVSLHDAVALEAGYSTRGSWRVSARADFPRIASGWRLHAAAEASRQPHFGNPDGTVERQRQMLRGEVTRTIAGPISVALRTGVVHAGYRVDSDDAVTLYPYVAFDPLTRCVIEGAQLPQPVGCRSQHGETDAQGRVAILVDLRDREYDTRNGMLLDVGYAAGTGVSNYDAVYGIARGWIAPAPRLRIAARGGFRAMSRNDGIDMQQVIPAWEEDITVLGGLQSHRALGEGELTGRGVLFAGGDVRFDVIRSGNIAAVTLIGFVDGGRAFRDVPGCDPVLCDPVPGTHPAPPQSGRLRFTLNDWTVGVGGGIAVRVLRNASLTATVGRANDATRWYIGTERR